MKSLSAFTHKQFTAGLGVAAISRSQLLRVVTLIVVVLLPASAPVTGIVLATTTRMLLAASPPPAPKLTHRDQAPRPGKASQPPRLPFNGRQHQEPKATVSTSARRTPAVRMF